MQKIKQSHISFLFQKKNSSKVSFISGILIIVLLSITFLGTWNLISNELFNSWSKLSVEQLKYLTQNRIFPEVASSFWQRALTFTYISNFAAGILLIIFAFCKNKKAISNILTISITYITITFLVFWGLVFPSILKDIKNSSNQKSYWWFVFTTIIHFINPMIAIVAFVLIKKDLVVSKYVIYWAFIFIFIYYLFALSTFFIGEKVTNIYLNNPQLKQELKEINIFSSTKTTIYAFLNFKHPLFYKGNSLFAIVGLNLLIFILGSILAIGITWTWIKVLKIKKYN
ncbi:hypothetical protein GE118_01675 [Mycoplasma sp. NEAQ87857]|uniref:MAGa3780 family membrane protein n=1 Tax=Mycoplasma sp. NEAQ87857 TaxID=2683967 RepID=UPI0013183148|nr:hypothetical protein [Mycoplasma sp. NEAQ87857]QGZ97505.1 hypothetical protein GE118_01675 [Mycoplasma sp. NEAQ87857]